MVATVFTAEAVAAGTTVATSNSGPTGTSTNAFYSGTTGIGASNIHEYSSTQAAHGTQSVRVERVSGTSPGYLQRTLSNAAREVIRIYVRFPSTPTSNYGIVRVLNSASSSIASLFVDSAGKIVLQNSAGSPIFTSTAAVPLDTWIRIELAVAPGTTTTSGAYEIAYYVGDSMTPVQTPATGTTANLGTDPTVGYVRVGRFDSTSGTSGYWYDDVATESKSSGLIGPAGVTNPTMVLTQVNGAAVANVRGSIAGSGGALSYSVAHVAGQVLTYTEPVDGIFVFEMSAAGSAQYQGIGNGASGGSGTVVIDIPQLIQGAYTPGVWDPDLDIWD